MSRYHNIDRAMNQTRADYVGYSNGLVYSIRRGDVEGWVAQERLPYSPEINPAGKRLFSRTLEGISKLLDELDPKSKRAKALADMAKNYFE